MEHAPQPLPTSDDPATANASSGGLSALARVGDTHLSIREAVYRAIHFAIVNGVLLPGERLNQDAIAASLGVSRPPVKAALVQLESEGLVAFQPRRGAIVLSLSLEQARELFEMREVLEPLALRRSMRQMTQERGATLRLLAGELDRSDNAAAFASASRRFYYELYDAENSPQLVELIEELRSRVSRYLVGWNALDGHRGGHAALVEHVLGGDYPAAEAMLLAHLRSVEDGYEKMIAAQG